MILNQSISQPVVSEAMLPEKNICWFGKNNAPVLLKFNSAKLRHFSTAVSLHISTGRAGLYCLFFFSNNNLEMLSFGVHSENSKKRLKALKRKKKIVGH